MTLVRRSLPFVLALLGAAAFSACLSSSELQCATGTQICGATCVATQTDPNNCGFCAIACSPGSVCVAGNCACPTIPAADGGIVLPGPTTCNGQCTNTATDPNNCGGCAGSGGVACAFGSVCSGGECLDRCPFNACPDSSAPDGGTCVDLNNDRQNCGACGNACLAGAQCQFGQCVTGIVAACIVGTSGSVVPLLDVATSPHLGPRADVGGTPSALGVLGQTLLEADGESRSLFELPLAHLNVPLISVEKVALGQYPAQVFVEPSDAGARVYTVSSGTNTLNIFDAPPTAYGRIDDDAGVTVGALGLTSSGGFTFGPNTSPEPFAKLGNHLFVPLFSTGQVVRLDVSNPVAPTVVDTFNLPITPSFNPDPSQALLHNGLVYVALNNLDSSYSPGPPMLAKIDPSKTGSAAVTALPLDSSTCLNVVTLAELPTSGGAAPLLVGCAGQAQFDPVTFETISVDRTAVLLLDGNDQGLAIWRPSTDAGVVPPVVGRIAVVGSRAFVADQSVGRVYVVDVSANSFVERFGYLNGGTPLNPCVDLDGGTVSSITDFAVIPSP
jgi:hypothetical protein